MSDSVKDGLAKTLFVAEPGTQIVTMTRVFNASPARVFDAMTQPDALRRWYGPAGVEVTVCDSDLRVGGAYRIVQRTRDGIEFGFRGLHRELIRPVRRVYTWIFEAMPDKEAIVTETFEEQGDKTLFTAVLRFQSVADRDDYLNAGATAGGEASMNRLAAFLKTNHVTM